jgi:uncharacterized membrane protein
MIRRWVFAGLMVWIPLGATLLVVRFALQVLDSSYLLPPAWRFPGLGVLLTVVVVLGTGALAANYLGAQLLTWIEGLLEHIPLVRSLYGGTKKLAETLFSEKSNSFRKVVMIEWPRSGQWSVGFQAGEPLREAGLRSGREMTAVFVPTTPNPTSGFLMQVPREDVVPLDLTVEEGMRYIISLGVAAPVRSPLSPDDRRPRAAVTPPA